MHFHFADGDDEHQSHAHAHAHGNMDTDHLTTEHEGEANTDILGALTKQSLLLDLLVVTILALLWISKPKSRDWLGIRNTRPRYYLLFFRPPLRAPPL